MEGLHTSGQNPQANPYLAQNQQYTVAPIVAPLGTVETQVDDRGRIRIPAEFAHFLNRLDSSFFLTTIDLKELRVYTHHGWVERAKLLQTQKADVGVKAADLLFLANHYGGSATMDGQFRMVLPERLRDKLDLKSKKIWLQWFDDHYNGYTAPAYQARLERAEKDAEAKVAAMTELGLI